MLKRSYLLVLVLFAILVSGNIVSAQRTFPGEVIGIVDGRTVTIKISSGQVNVQLQYIDVPDNVPQMQTMVKEHLRALAVGKMIEYRPRNLMSDRTIGQLWSNGVDLSQQMLRDGAAWLVPSQLSGQERTEFDLYAATEAAAKNEKLGIWSAVDLKPSWERIVTVEAKKINAPVSMTESPPSKKIEKVRTGKWGDVNPKLGNVGAVHNGYNAESRTGFLSTGISMVNLSNAGLDERFQNAKLFADFTYWYKESETGRDGTFVFTLISENDTPMFARDQEMVIIGEKGKIAVGRGKRYESRSGGKVFEKLTFNVSRANVERMTNDVTVMKIADHLLEPQTIRYILFNMLQVAK
ncbi:MAG TPA: thermonuclease family protein [Pyrinomonadaceae bacterium]|nr:thermonuclease family protein [Pyrinomonadaceae bacterium]